MLFHYNLFLNLFPIMKIKIAKSEPTITSDVYTIQLTGVDSVDEDNGFLSTNVNFQSIIKTYLICN